MSRNYSLSDLKYIKPVTLRSWFSNGSSPHGKFCVVDVRESDFVGGNIKGCYHYPAGNFHYTLDELYNKIFTNQINDVVFHCALSQVRGPSSTLKFLRGIDNVKNPELKSYLLNKIHVYVLKGGFTRWQQHYGTDNAVTEAYDKEIWEFGL
ncbi:conserved hypothetical protein [Candida tropicalis MYA-3404]|uniref:Rhodanese domain-containing protein n=1 Tax=Candida tropicalis (strain ATCC MYA-3404 / T1) TaxID=294747 RepID=C5M1Z8_CANTT|nr:conserved hypothetical protein [Candida tropicalis MYA-3404]EER35348.1 conserved hypothetical protein [Candida tropicalis MYA-3404]KAG4409451.1 hypothetical protein JTP64_000089 [Candida tropicalis]MCP8719020.1 rhodanese-like domain-containing protein [Asgard group archaeon]